MATPKKQNLTVALSRDLRPPGSKECIKVVDDTARKVFTAHRDGAVLVFGHKQPDAAFWNGVKHYGSGATSKIRVRRSPAVKAEESLVQG
jgi:hypothetical protein